MTLFRPLIFVLAMAAPNLVSAQGLFSPAITVNDSVVTNYEIDQRIKLLTLFRTPGNLPELAREQLIEDRLKAEEAKRAGLRLSEDAMAQAMDDFAGRANMSLDQFLVLLNQNGIDKETLADFVSIGVTWRDFVRLRYGNRVNITEADIDRALGNQAGGDAGIEVLLSEIIIPAPPPQAAQAMQTAQRISGLTSEAAFSAEARRVSALPSKTNGGRLNWLPITNYPPALRGILLALGKGEVTAPLPITNGVALFQLRGVREVAQGQPDFAAIEYMTYLIAGAPEDTLAKAASVAGRVDTCDDLYGEAKGQPEENLLRSSLPPADIPQNVAIALANLDAGEVNYSLTDATGTVRQFIMMCGRTPAIDAEVDREAIRTQLRGERLTGYADGLLADLKAAATIITQ